MKFSFPIRRLFRKAHDVSSIGSTQSAVDHVRKLRNRRIPTIAQLRNITRVFSPSERWIFRLSLALLFVGCIWGTGSLVLAHTNVVPVPGGQYREGIIGTPEFINPLFSSVNDVDQDMTRLIYSGLMRYSPEQELVLDIAASMTVSEDKKVYTFTLRDDVVWHDHTDQDPQYLTADDVVFTFSLIQNRQVNSPLFVAFDGVVVQKLDEQTVQFVLKEPFLPFLSSLTVGILPEHIWGTITPERMRLTQINIRPIGSGPFKAASFEQDDTGYISSYTLTRFDLYHGDPAYLEKITLRFFREYEGPFGAITALREQKIDGLNFVPHDLRSRVERKHLVIHTLELPQYTALFFNKIRQPILGDVILRRSLRDALDVDRIARESLQGESRAIAGPILRGFPGFSEERTLHTPNIDGANAALDEAGYTRISVQEYSDERRAALRTEIEALLREQKEVEAPPQVDTEDPSVVSSTELTVLTSEEEEQVLQEVERRLAIEITTAQPFYRKTKDGQLLTIDLLTADTVEYRRASQLIGSAWQDIGIDVRVRHLDPSIIQRDGLTSRSYDVLLYGLIVGSDPDQYPFWHSSQVQAPGLNLAQYSNETIDDLLKKAREETDDTLVASLYSEFESVLLEDIPAIFLYTPIYTYVTHERIQGVSSKRIFTPADRFAGITKWYIKTRRTF